MQFLSCTVGIHYSLKCVWIVQTISLPVTFFFTVFPFQLKNIKFCKTALTMHTFSANLLQYIQYVKILYTMHSFIGSGQLQKIEMCWNHRSCLKGNKKFVFYKQACILNPVFGGTQSDRLFATRKDRNPSFQEITTMIVGQQ